MNISPTVSPTIRMHAVPKTYMGETVIELQQGYICMDCRTEAVFEGAARDDLIEFITSNNLEDKLADWFYEPYEQEL